MKASRHPLYHRFLTLLRQNNIQNQKLFLALSGGVDSVSLLSLMAEVQHPLNLRLFAGYVHHGWQKEPYRDEAFMHLYSICQGYGLPFFSNTPTKTKKTASENDLRKIRYQHLTKWKKKTKADDLVLAHTADDLLETRLIRLIRGTGGQGLKSMSFLKDQTLRPFIFFTKNEIKNYAVSQKLKWIEDPTNKQTQFLRNWVRNTWLLKLEKKHQGAVRNLCRSLDKISEELDLEKNPLPDILTPQGLDRKKLLKLSLLERKKTLAQYMKLFHLKNYGQNHIQEILKYLKTPSDKKFILLGRTWRIDSQFVGLQKKK